MFERESELQTIDDALAAARGGDGRLVLFEGPAGIGKTSLLEAAREPAARAGMTVLIGRAGELERNFPYGLVRQLLETPVRTADADRRGWLLADAAGLAAPTLLGDQGGPSDATPDATFGVLHGLYWLVANLATEAPLLLLVDDVQWADPASLRFLLYLARRLDGLPAAVIGSLRTGAAGPQQELISALELSPGAVVSEPRALSREGVADVLSEAFGRQPEPGFTSACHVVTSGNPFYIRELATALMADGAEPEDAESHRVEQAAPKTIASSTLVRLGHMSRDAAELARAIAVLGPHAGLPRAAALAALSEERALVALDALIAAHVIVSSEHRLAFRHPIVRTAIYEELSPGARSTAHGLAARQLASGGAELDAVAGHLLLTEPIGSAETISTLRAAAAHALTVGAPDAAATYLARALTEGPEAELRTDLLLELGIAKKLARRPDALAHLDEVSRTAQDPLIRARALLEQTSMLVFQGSWDEPKALLDRAISELGDRDPGTRARAEAVRAGLTAFDPRMVAEFDGSLPALRELARAGGDSARPLALLLAGFCVQRGDDRDEILEMIDRGWDGGLYVTDGESEELLPQCLSALIALDELERALAVCEAVQAVATETGSVLHHLLASANRAWVESRRGNLTLSAAEMRGCFERVAELGLTFGLASVVAYGVDVLLERPDQADLVQLTETVELGPLSDLTAGALVYGARGQLRFAAGNRDGAIDDLRRAGKIYTAEGFGNPNGYATWRSSLATMLAPEQRDEALALATAELDDARRVGQPRGIGVALRALATLEPDTDDCRALHEEAVRTLKRSPSRLEEARALVELGSHLRRHGERAAARTPLREGLDLASRGGAIRLAERARAELAAAGARPRTEFVTGRDALTPSELRVALMAAEGRTSREIAQALFVTTRTIDAHLSHCYMKLGINSRRELAAALE